MIDDDRISLLDDNLKQAKFIAEEREQMYEEVCVLQDQLPTNSHEKESRLEPARQVLLSCALSLLW